LGRADGQRPGRALGHADKVEDLDQHGHCDNAAADAQKAGEQADQHSRDQQGDPDARG
jgi:hypothetical protein